MADDLDRDSSRRIIFGPFSGTALLPDKHDYADNVIKTSKYTWWSFLPKALFYQFRRFGNLYFLICGLLMLVGESNLQLYESPTSAWSTLGTLVAVLTVQLIMEARDDCRRRSKDKETNTQSAHRLDRTFLLDAKNPTPTLESTEWRHLVAGDIVVVRKNEPLPADVVVLASSYCEDGEFFIETKNIDGESTLKLRSAVMQTHMRCSNVVAEAGKTWNCDAAFKQIATTPLQVMFEEPNNKVYRFRGCFAVPSLAESDFDVDMASVRDVHLSYLACLHRIWLSCLPVFVREVC